jgi:hypothetical protein
MTDHRAEAEDWLEYSSDQNPGVDGKAMHSIALAQVHATLALVDATLAHTAAMERIARSSTPVLGQRL